MIVLPCSMGTLAAIALGLANSLIARAADVTLKERRPLMLCVRETPFNRIHLRNMTLAAEAGATIFPCIPAFYNQPAGSDRDGPPVRLPRAGPHRPAAARRVRLEAGENRELRTEGDPDARFFRTWDSALTLGPRGLDTPIMPNSRETRNVRSWPCACVWPADPSVRLLSGECAKRNRS